jgi:hypothetical protein
MPSSLSSNSHRLLTAIVDSRQRKVYKVKNCVTDIDPEREKEEKEKVQSIIPIPISHISVLCLKYNNPISLIIFRLKVRISGLTYFLNVSVKR